MKKTRRSRSATHLLSSSPLALTALLAPAGVFAQSAEQEPQLTEVVVTGLRQSIQTSQEINAGTVNLRTGRPLDHEGFTAGLTGSANFALTARMTF